MTLCVLQSVFVGKGGGEGGQQRGKLACANSEASRRGRRVARKNIDDELRRVILLLQIAFFFFFIGRENSVRSRLWRIHMHVLNRLIKVDG